MNFVSPAKRLLCVFGLGVLLSACGGDPAPTTTTFTTDIYPAMKSACGSCHNTGGVAAKNFIIDSASAANTYTNLTSKQLINTSAAASSKLTMVGSGGMYTPAAGGAMMAHPASLPAAQKTVWETWIGNGAPQ